ncbi:MAG: nuclear transport factor 2 family protein [Actinomycetes bacterium]
MPASDVDDVTAVRAANAVLYAAIEDGDLDQMGALWVDGPWAAGAVCVHPGWTTLRGRTEVLRSWALVMAGTSYIQFVLTDVHVMLEGDVAVLTCTENILAGVDEPGAARRGTGLAGAHVVATNVFRRDPARSWRLWAHHGSVVVGGSPPFADVQDQDEDPPGTPRGGPP